MSGAFALLPLALAAALAAPPAAKPADFSGRWLTEVKLGSEITVLQIKVKTEGSALNAKADLSPAGPTEVAVRSLAATANGIRFEVATEPVPLTFEGKVAKDPREVEGTVRRGETRGSFRMVHLAPSMPRPQRDAVTGTYMTKDGKAIWIGPFGEFGADLYYLDYSTGRFGALYPRTPFSFVGGPGITRPVFPLEVSVEIDTDASGGATALRYRAGKGPEIRAAREVPIRKPAKFRNGDVRLSGTLSLPPGTGPFPAVILIHGSGPEDHDYLGPWVDFFVHQGVAVLAYDKRGVGASGGDWKTSGLAELTSDAESALRALTTQPEVDAHRIGLFGISQGGWIVPRLAAGLRDKFPLAFAIAHSGAAVSPAQQGMQHLERELRAYGVDQKSIEEALAFQRQDDEFTRSGKGWDELQAAYKKAVDAKAPWLFADLRPADDVFRTMYRKMMDYDPLPDWRRLRCPVWAYYGGLDLQVPADPNAELLRKALTENGKVPFEIAVLPKANHLALVADKGVLAEYPALHNFDPEYFPRLAAWLRKEVTAPAEAHP